MEKRKLLPGMASYIMLGDRDISLSITLWTNSAQGHFLRYQDTMCKTMV